jgi:4'-phosphopantetheinyl transferase
VLSQLKWPVSGIRGEIVAEEVHLWAWPLEPRPFDLTAHVELLNREELQRMHSFRFAPDRSRYAVAHANLRRILGAYLGRLPERLCFRANRFGKPELADEDRSSSVHFSLSHSRTIAVLAVALEEPVGVDVEDVRPIEPEVAEAHFSATEIFALSSLRGDAWLSGFYRCWTRKEAILKAEGVGLHSALDGFDVSLLPDAPAELLGTREPIHFHYPWKLHDVSPASGTIGALATACDQAKLACFSFVP